METVLINHKEPNLFDEQVYPEIISTDKPFIQANTVPMTLEEIRSSHVIPVFTKDNEPAISHGDFIESTMELVSSIFTGETILKPTIRVSHPIKGRIPEAKDKPANVLLDHEKTLYYERMAFVIEIPSICEDVAGNPLSLTIGGVKAYNLDNLNTKKGSEEHFKTFIGFQNGVCTNLCIRTDGYLEDLRVKNLDQLRAAIQYMIKGYSAQSHLDSLRGLENQFLTEQQFAHMVGRCRMYNHLSNDMKADIPPLLLSDTQLGTVVKDYYKDVSFCRDEDGNINLWRLYNLLTGSNKTSYIDTFIDRSIGAFNFVNEVKVALEEMKANWYLE